MVLPHTSNLPSLLTLCLLYTSVWVLTIQAFNLDLLKPTVYTGPSDSDFGYSVALLLSDFRGSQVLIGAPRANSTGLLNNNILNGGAVYRCPIDNNLNCQTIDVDNRPPIITNRNTIDEPKFWDRVGEERSNQLLGASLVTSDDGTIATCAPHYINFGPRVNKREPTGDCWVSKDAGTRFTRVTPCLDRFTVFYFRTYINESSDNGWASYHKTGHGMCGFSVALGPNNELGVGAPGNFYFHGELYSVAPQSDYRNYIYTGAGETEDDNSYLSWDVKYGEFDGDEDTIDWAATAPRSHMLQGKVTIWSKTYLPLERKNKLTTLINITGTQPGAYFGYAIAVGNFNGDDLDDIAVGAPFFANYGQDLMEIGQVSVHYQRVTSGRHSFEIPDKITGEDRKGRFGLSMANVGDINLDGFDDLMVGAPYAGPDNKGVVYLYHGSKDGLVLKPIQVIQSEDVAAPALSTFGWSIAGKMDIDNNRYTDVAVGAYKSNSAVLFKTRPLINIQGLLTTTKQAVQLPVPCSKDWDTVASKGFMEISVSYCISYSVRDSPTQISLKSKLIFDSAKNGTKRAFQLQTGASMVINTLNLAKDTIKCINDIRGYIQVNIRDKTSPVNISLEFELDGSNIPSGQVLPIINQLAPRIEPLQIQLNKSCDSCNPDLNISVTSPTEHYILGTDGKIDLNIELSNSGEDSYLTSLNITLPDDVSYVNVVPIGEQCIPVACKQINVNGTEPNYVTCDVGNPFPQDQSVSFTVQVRLEDFHKIDDYELIFSFNVNSSFGDDLDDADNRFDLAIPMKVETSIFVTGNSYPIDAITYNTSHIDSRVNRGPSVIHQYDIYTRGPSAIDTAEVVITWPLYTSDDMDEYLLYIYENAEIITQPESDTRMSCVIPDRYINPQNVSLDGITVLKTEPEVDSINKYKRAVGDRSNRHITCENGRAHCITMQCRIKTLRKGESVTLKILSFLWMGSAFRNMTQDYTKEAVISSTAEAVVTDVPYVIKAEVQSINSFSVMSYFEKYRPTKVVEPLQWKWIAIGVGCGLLLLIIIILILWRCGFFKRYRPYAEAKIEKHKDGTPHETERLYSGYH